MPRDTTLAAVCHNDLDCSGSMQSMISVNVLRRFRRLVAWAPMSILGTGLCAGSAPARPADSAVSGEVRLFEARYRAAKTLQATFLERYTENGQVVRSEAG